MDSSLAGGNGLCLRALGHRRFKASAPILVLPATVRDRPGAPHRSEMEPKGGMVDMMKSLRGFVNAILSEDFDRMPAESSLAQQRMRDALRRFESRTQSSAD